MSSMTTVDLLQMETNLFSRSKKLPPPPLCLPATNPATDEVKVSNSHQQPEQKRPTNNCCLVSSPEDCPHKPISYILPASQRPQILETLMASSSALLVPPASETKPKKPYTTAYANQIHLLKQRQSSSSKVTITDAEWIDFMRLVIHKPLECELQLLLDKYKINYFDRVNASNTTDDTIRSTLCAIVSETLEKYSSCSILSSTPKTDNSTTNNSTTTNNGSLKRKRKNTGTTQTILSPVTINNQTKFVISHIIPGKCDNDDKTTGHHHQKQFQTKYTYLFRYIPDKEEQEYFAREGHLKHIPGSTHSPNNICLMLYNEVVDNMDDDDFELSGISVDDAFTLPESILGHIYSSIQ